MSLDTFISVACFILLPICYGIYRYCDKNVKMTYKDQKVGVRTKWWRR